MKDRISCIVLLALCHHNQAEPTAFPTLGPSASPAPTPDGRTRYLKGTKHSSSSNDDLVDGTTDGQLHSLIPGDTSEAPSSGGNTQDPKTPALEPFQKPSTALSTVGTVVPSSLPSSTSFPSLAASDYPSGWPSASPTLGQALTPPSFVLQTTGEPTLAPSLGPSSVPSLAISSEPSNPPSIIEGSLEYCNLEATVDCRLEDGSSCSSLSALSSKETAECLGRPYELEWLYMAGSCNDSSTDASFECRDENGGPSSVFLAYLTITGLTSNEEYYSSFIFQGINGFPVQRIILKHESDPYKQLDVEIHVVVSKGSPSGEILQEMTIPIACVDGNQLYVGDSFGALQLASHRYEESSSIQAFEDISWIYTVKNTGNAASVLKTIAAGTSSGDLTEISPDISLLPGENYHVIAHETISLVESSTFIGELVILEGSDMDKCRATSNYAFNI